MVSFIYSMINFFNTKNINTQNVSPIVKQNVPVCISHKGTLSDEFVRTTADYETVKDCAKSFRKYIIEPFQDWKDKSLPEDGEKGCDLLNRLLMPYIEAIKKYSNYEAEEFVKLTFGEDTLKVLEDSCLKNSSLRSLKEILEEKTEKRLLDIVSTK